MPGNMPATLTTAAALFLSATFTLDAAALDSVFTVTVFDHHDIHFDTENQHLYATENVTAEDNGRVITTVVSIPQYETPARITAELALYPIPEDERRVHDPWDRAGNVRLAVAGMADIEIVKFITAYGGRTEHEVDVSHLAPLLKDECTFIGFIDTWVSPAWQIDFRLRFEPDTDTEQPVWVEGMVYEQSFDSELEAAGGTKASVVIPTHLDRILLHYYSSGHCTDGRGADEFVSKDNVIYVDDRVVYRFRPWRDDCREFRQINPYCARWSDGTWSSDYSRSGWCPGQPVEPMTLDLTDHLTPGTHSMRFIVEDVRPVDKENQKGYWRLSAHLTGWRLPRGSE